MRKYNQKLPTIEDDLGHGKLERIGRQEARYEYQGLQIDLPVGQDAQENGPLDPMSFLMFRLRLLASGAMLLVQPVKKLYLALGQPTARE